MGVRINPARRTIKNVYRTYIDVITYIKQDKRRNNDEVVGGNEDKPKNDQEMKEEDADYGNGAIQEAAIHEEHVYFTDQEVAQFKELAAKPDVYDLLIDSLAPSIWENRDVKQGILCQLFGGVSKEFAYGGRGRFRGEINVLLCGDPSTAKSQLL